MNPGSNPSNTAASMELYFNLPPRPSKREVDIVVPLFNSKKPKTQAPPDLTLSLHLPVSSATMPTSRFAPRSSGYVTFNSDVPAASEGSDLLAIKPNKPNLKDFVFYPLAGAGTSTPEINNDNNKGSDLDSEELVLGLPGKFLEDIVSRSVPRMAEVIRLLSDEFVNAVKDHLNDLIRYRKNTNELTDLQCRLQGRSDLTVEVLTRAHRAQLEILVAIKTGLQNFLRGDNIPSGQLVEIFMHFRCKNVDCNIRLPLNLCSCKVCLKDKGFCTDCTCRICLKFDNRKNDTDTCTWIKCGQCLHWCHMACGIEGGLIGVTIDLNETPEMVFCCPTPRCGSEYGMFEFVKDKFKECGQRWGRYEMMKEMSCIIQIFKESGDPKGMELQKMVEAMRGMLGGRLISPREVLDEMLRFFKCKSK